MILTTDIHWLAGLLEGEGSFSRWEKQPAHPMISVGMTDEAPINKVSKLFGINYRVRYANGPHGKLPMYELRIKGSHAVAWMMTLYSLMSPRRKARIKELLEGWKQTPNGTKTTRWHLKQGNLREGDQYLLPLGIKLA